MLKKSNMATGAGDISLPDVSKLNDLKDDQIEALIEKLAEVQAHAPQIIAALEAQQEARSRGSRGSERNKGGNSDRGERTQPPRQQQQQQEEEDGDDYDEDEDDDEFDEDAEYPMVGDGYSDEISVVSDMTTPTVVSSLEINEEEYYRDMMVGSGMKMNAPKKKDMLSQVAKANARKGPVAAAPPAGTKKKVGAGAADTALKKPARVASMHATPRQEKGAAAAGSSPAAAVAKEGKKKKTKEAGTTPTGTKKVKKKTVKKKAASPSNTGSGWGDANGGAAAAAAGGPSTTNKKKGPQQDKAGAAPTASAPVMIDDDGFLVDQSTFETFDSSNNPFARAPSFTADATAADDAFGAFANFGETDPAPAPSKKSTKPKKLNVNSKEGKKKNSGTGSVSSPKQKRKGTRRASLTG